MPKPTGDQSMRTQKRNLTIAFSLSIFGTLLPMSAQGAREQECRAAIDSMRASARVEDLRGNEAAAAAALVTCQGNAVPDSLIADALLLAKWSNSATLSEAAARTESAFAIASKLEPRGELLIRATEALSDIRFLQHKPEDSERLLEDAWDLRRAVFGIESAEDIAGQARLASGLLSLAQLNREMNAAGVAERHLSRALQESRSAFDRASSRFNKGHRVTVEAAVALDAALRASGFDSEAEKIFESDIRPYSKALADAELR
jgi:hypothetical protein